ncbi:MAG: hypothetical protein ABR976_10520, partial [Terracidiphilus sp.]
FPHFHRRDDHEQYMKTSPKETSEDARIKHPLQAHSWIGKDFCPLVEGEGKPGPGVRFAGLRIH